MLNLGKVKPGSTIYIPFDSFAGTSGNSITISDFAVADILIYKDGNTTQRNSVSGITLLDTDGIDFDGVTGIHGFSIDLSDNDTSGFYTAGSKYFVVVGPITIDSQVINFIAGNFNIGYDGAILDTTIATLASQTSFTLSSGPADNNALNGCVALIHDLASAIQIAVGVVSAYTGSTKTVTLSSDPGIFTMAAGDNISFFPAVNSKFIGQTVQTTGDVYSKIVEVDNVVGNSGEGLSGIPWHSTWDAEIESEVADVFNSGVNITKWNGVAVATPSVSGVPIVDIGYITGIAASTATIEDIYYANIDVEIGDSNSNDLYSIVWFKNGVPKTSSVTLATITVIEVEAGTTLINAKSLTEVPTSTGYWYYKALTTERLTVGKAYLAILTATIDSSSRTCTCPFGRDG